VSHSIYTSRSHYVRALSQAVAKLQGSIRQMSEGTLGWIVVVGYIGLIAVLTGAETVPAFRSMGNPFVKINEVVRGFLGGY
jgi:hypothetical protein